MTPSSDIDDNMARLLNLCEKDPDKALEFIESRSNVLESTKDLYLVHFIKFCEALAYGSKGFLKFWHENMDNQNFKDKDMKYFRNEVGLNEEKIKYLEIAMQKVKEILDYDTEFLKDFGPEKEKIGGVLVDYSMGEAKIDIIASVLERCKPGKVQEILGMTKLMYFGIDRIRFIKSIDEKSLNFGLFENIFFSAPSIVKSALIMGVQPYKSGHNYLECTLFKKTVELLGPEETLETLEPLNGVVWLYPDRTYSYIDLEKEISELESNLKCNNCGAKLNEGMNFCQSCGNKI